MWFFFIRLIFLWWFFDSFVLDIRPIIEGFMMILVEIERGLLKLRRQYNIRTSKINFKINRVDFIFIIFLISLLHRCRGIQN